MDDEHVSEGNKVRSRTGKRDFSIAGCANRALLEKWVYYLTVLTGFLGVALLPLDIGPFTLFPYRILFLLLGGLFVLRVLSDGWRSILQQINVRSYLIFLALWFGYALFSLTWAASKGAAAREIILLFMGISMICFSIYYLREEHDFRRMLWIWLGILVGFSLLGFWEHITGSHLWASGLYGEIRVRFMYRPTGVFRNPNDYSAFLALGIPFCLALFRHSKRNLLKLFGLVVAIAAFYLILSTRSRANLLAVCLELLLFAAFVLADRRRDIRQRALQIGGLTLVFLIPNLVWYLRDAASAWQQIATIEEEAQLGEGSMAIRINLIRNGLSFLGSTKGFGVGAGNAMYWMMHFARFDTSGTLSLHNWWLEILTNYGIYAFLGYVGFYASLLWRLFRQYYTLMGEEAMLGEAILISLVGFFFAGLGPSSIMAWAPHWFLFAFALAFLNYRRGENRGERTPG
jgi:teichuronic acid biosynthesis protein TuaE